MPQLQLHLYTITLFFLLSAVFVSSAPPCSRQNRCSRGLCTSTTTALPKSSAAPSITPTPVNSNPVTQATPSPPGSALADTSAADIQAYLTAHNSVRAQHGAVPLTWSDNLASAAQKWANGCVFQHSGGTLGPYGENLAAGTGSYDIASAVGFWAEEVSDYDPNNPVPSHFTQIVWKATTQVGCAVQTCNGIFPASYGPAQYYVCEYFVEGNVIGSFSQNVQV